MAKLREILQISNGRQVLKEVIQKVDGSRWTKPSAGTFVSTCNSFAGLIPATEVAYVVHTDTKELNKILMDKQKVKIKW